MAFFRTLAGHRAVCDLADELQRSPFQAEHLASPVSVSLHASNGQSGQWQSECTSKDLSLSRLESSRSIGADLTPLTSLLYQGAPLRRRVEMLRAVLESDDLFGRNGPYRRSEGPFLDRDESYRAALLKIRRLWELRKKHAWSEADMVIVHELVDEPLPLYIHTCLFIPTLQHSCNLSQKQRWLQAALDWRIIGAYAQTELGHGSNVRGGIETTATYSAKHDGFILHTPTITSRKWWPGGLAQSVTHALVYARLVVGGADYGPSAFMLQIRSTRTGHDLAGITTGNIGPKVGFHPIDNGWMTLDNVVVPRDHLLSASYAVHQAGQLNKTPNANPVLSYRTMLGARFGIIHLGGRVLAKASTIGIRFATLRRQFKHVSKPVENQIISYSSLQWRLLVPLAASYVFHLSSLDLLTSLVTSDFDDVATLKDAHATASALKVFVTGFASAGLEEIRRSLGGHGYSKAAGIPDLSASFLQMVTVEGDNYIISQQASRRLMAILEAVIEGTLSTSRLPEQYAYLDGAAAASVVSQENNIGVHSAADFASPAMQQRFLALAALNAALQTREALRAERASGKSAEEAWDACLIFSDTAVLAYAILSIHSRFQRVMERIQISHAPTGSLPPKIVELLVALRDLFFVAVCTTAPSPLSGMPTPLILALQHRGKKTDATRFDTATTTRALEELRRKRLELLAPHALALAEAWGFSDWELGAPVAPENGDLYGSLVSWAARDPMNSRHAQTNRRAWVDILGPLANHPSGQGQAPSPIAGRPERRPPSASLLPHKL
ncbi:acyl-CoA oxidase [Ceraceosorus guamensis]|uniref:Acyl-coenzyme A oxidase n=1 Tax=Ceraceosorus guamensis TaxID=1522189 RepID=A0A316VSA1_9BASI|nr:acyl-CoA oxidase [Ceraceosorus guamensis]PWN39061.1 acyl-CoA oxidase [Ceraceosorus guamensis]